MQINAQFTIHNAQLRNPPCGGWILKLILRAEANPWGTDIRRGVDVAGINCVDTESRRGFHSECFKHLFGIIRCLDLGHGFDYDPLLVYKICGAYNAHTHLAGSLFLAPCAVLLDDPVLGV